MRKLGFLCVRVVALSVLMMRCSGGRQRVEGLFLGFRDTAIVASPELNVYLVCGVLLSFDSIYLSDEYIIISLI